MDKTSVVLIALKLWSRASLALTGPPRKEAVARDRESSSKNTFIVNLFIIISLNLNVYRLTFNQSTLQQCLAVIIKMSLGVCSGELDLCHNLTCLLLNEINDVPNVMRC